MLVELQLFNIIGLVLLMKACKRDSNLLLDHSKQHWINVLVNEEKTRTFIAIQVQSSKALEQVVKCCDDSLLEFDIQDKFYDPPEFHISFAWILGDQTCQLKSALVNPENIV